MIDIHFSCYSLYIHCKENTFSENNTTNIKKYQQTLQKQEIIDFKENNNQRIFFFSLFTGEEAGSSYFCSVDQPPKHLYFLVQTNEI